MASGRVSELWIYPVKACRGVSVKEARLTATGFEYDRAWCVVDLDGKVVSKLEAISQRKIPVLCTISVSISPNGLTLDAPGMPSLTVPLEDGAGYGTALQVECSGRSTTTGGGWSLGFEDARVHDEGTAWFTEYLNRPHGEHGRRLHGHEAFSNFGFVRGISSLAMEEYPPIFPLLAKAKEDMDYKLRLAGNRKRFADFAPLLIVCQASCHFVGERVPDASGGATAVPYPVMSLRGNVVVEGTKPWDEETWKRIEICSSSGEHVVNLRKIKECPRCTSPCRDQLTGDWVFPSVPLTLWNVLGEAFPAKRKDEEWATWAGPFMGVYFGNNGMEGATVRVGDLIRAVETCRWDDHQRRRVPVPWIIAVAAVGVIAAAAWARSKAR